MVYLENVDNLTRIYLIFLICILHLFPQTRWGKLACTLYARKGALHGSGCWCWGQSSSIINCPHPSSPPTYSDPWGATLPSNALDSAGVWACPLGGPQTLIPEPRTRLDLLCWVWVRTLAPGLCAGSDAAQSLWSRCSGLDPPRYPPSPALQWPDWAPLWTDQALPCGSSLTMWPPAPVHGPNPWKP